ncbi:sodium:solute symporter family protein [Puniceicoccales bacterium CK1056]|uniref:Sodium:solute symporter family protein n=1 Tax=Oceanipulchritudo coccoides TaxID=2706888 RepID=A0A6B2LYS1_9BACT|nr:sodium:solute symporter family protein [Oceanipulchritudo coccoides]NDV61312.1 sodium:solute symporter family protein [Oceanipulchritudo coccoides]
MSFHPLDFAIVAAYFVVVVVLGWIKKAQPKDEDYLLMGRQLTLPGFLLSLVSTWYGGILGSSEYSYSYGFSNWIVFGVPYYVFAILFAIVLARRARRKYVVSIPHLIGENYGPAGRVLSGILVLILATPAPYVLTIGVLLHFLFGVPLVPGIIAGALFSFIYVYRDGLAVVVRTDLFQCILMYGGYIVLFLFAWWTWESPVQLWEAVRERSPDHVSVTGGSPVSYILVWFFMASWTLVSPMFHQRVYALKDERNARRGIVFAVLMWTVFDFLTTFVGLYAFVHLPDLSDPRISHLALGEAILPIGAYGLFITGILSVVMSTLDSELFVSGVTLGPDILGRMPGVKRLRKSVLTRIGMALVALVSIGFAIFVPSVVDIYYTIGTLAVPGLLLPVLSSAGAFPSVPPRFAVAHLVVVPLVAATWYIAGRAIPDTLPAIEAFYPGCAASILIWSAGLLVGRSGKA